MTETNPAPLNREDLLSQEVPTNDAAQVATINAMKPFDIYLEHRKTVEPNADTLDKFAALRSGTWSPDTVLPAEAKAPTSEAIDPSTGLPDTSIPAVPGEKSEARMKAEQRDADERVAENQRIEANKDLPPAEMSGLSSVMRSVTKFPGDALDTGLKLLSPFQVFPAMAEAVGSPSNTGDLLTDLKNDFVNTGKAMGQGLQGEYDSNNGAKVVERMGLTGNTAAVAGETLNILMDPSMALSLGFVGVVNKGMQIAKAQALAGGTATKTSTIMRDGLTEVLTFSTGLDQAQVTQASELARIADETGSKKSIQDFNDYLADVPELETAAKLAEDAKAQIDLDSIAKTLGDTNAPRVVQDTTNVTDEMLQASLRDSDDYIPTVLNTSTVNTIEQADGLIDEVLETHRANYDIMLDGASPQTIRKTAGRQNHLLSNVVSGKVQTLRGREAYAARQALISSAVDLKRLAQNTREVWSSKLDNLAFEKALGVHRRMVERLTKRDEAASNIFNNYNMDELANKSLVTELKSSAFAAKASVDVRLLIKEFIRSDPDPTVISKVAEKSKKARFADAAFELYVNNILSGPVTQSVNLSSNALMTLWRPSENILSGISAAGQGTLRALAGNEGANAKFYDAGTDFMVATSELAGIVQGFGESMRLLTRQTSWDKLKLDGTHFASGEIARMRLKSAITKENYGLTGNYGKAVDVLGSLIRVPGAALVAEDKMFKLMHYRSEVNGQAIRAARDKGGTATDVFNNFVTARNNPAPAVVQDALTRGEKFTFTTELGTIGTKSHQLIKALPTGRFFIPFFATPTNIIKMGIKNAAFSGEFSTIKNAIAKGGPEGDQARAKLALGTMIPMMIITSLDEDRITFGIDESTPKGRLDALNNKPPYSLRIGDEWRSYEKLEPFRTILGFYGNAKEAISAVKPYKDDDDPNSDISDEMFNIVTATIGATIQNIDDVYLLQQLGGIMGMLTSLQNDEPDYALKQFTKLGLSFVPASGAVRQVNKHEFDGKLRMANGVIENLKKMIPIYSRDLPVMPTYWGDEQITSDSWGPDLISPIKTQAVKSDWYDQEIARLDVSIPRIPKEISVEGLMQPVPLTTAQQARFGYIRGKGLRGDMPVKEAFKETLDDSEFRTLADKEQKLLLDRMVESSTALAKGLLIGEDKELQKTLEAALLYQEEVLARERNNKKYGVAP